ncbi:hypothetical protein [Corynebacterium sp. A21]|uniref:hypothetical protein n=1 Tax=Corynebacterium sp. A21 TaxID=3457318 RepID=UPI003FD53AB0
MCSIVVGMDTTRKAFRLVPASDLSTYLACDIPDEDDDYVQFDEIPSIDINDL